MSITTPKPIAVIGMACRYPGASNLLELWENILSRRQQFRDMPDGRLPRAEYHNPDPSILDKTYALKAAVIDGFDFDPGAHRIPKSTFVATDIVHWLALATALEALGNACLDKEFLPRETMGVILGNTLTGEETRTGAMRLRWPFVSKVLRRATEAHGLAMEATDALEASMEELYKSVFPAVTEDTLAGGLANTIAGRICNYLDLHGGGYIVDGACSSSLIAIATAADYLNQNKMDMVVAGGVDMSLDPFELVGFSKATALTHDQMRVYDRRGNGFIPGEGCGMVVLQRLEDARRDGHRVYAVLRGWGISSDGRGGMTAPSAQGQTRALLRAYQSAGYAPQSLAFVEGHGTGTAVGDRIELEGIAGALAAHGPIEDHSIGVTSFKSIYGHTKAAAGIGGFIKAAIAVNRRVVPPTAGCSEPHAGFAGAARSLYPVLQGEVRGAGGPFRAGVSAMGFGGINCHLTLECGDPPAADLAPALSERALLASRQETEVIPLAAEDLPGLIQAAWALREAAQGLGAGELVDLAASSACGVRGLPWRAAVVAGSVEELATRLDELLRRLMESPPAPGRARRGERVWIGHALCESRVGFLFPGQGSQQIGMAGGLIERFDDLRDFLRCTDAEVAAVRAAHGGPGDPEALSQIFLRRTERDPAQRSESLWKKTLNRTENAQPAICIASWAWKQRLEALGIVPQVVGGHSLGELSALAVADAYGPETLVRIAALRGAAMATPGENAGGMGMLTCGAEQAKTILRNAGSGYCVVANLNSPVQTVISGDIEAVRGVVEYAGRSGIRAVLLPVSNGFHSRLVEPAAALFRGSDQVPTTAGRFGCRVFSSTDGREITEGLDLRAHLAHQIVARVDFTRMAKAMSEHCDWLVEVGPGRVLSGLVQSHEDARMRPCFPVESRPGRDADFNAVVAEAFIRGVDLNWERLYDNRLVRPFVPASERKFYVNPCERPLPMVNVKTPPRPSMDNGPGPEALLAGLVETAKASLGAEYGTVLLYDQESNHLCPPAAEDKESQGRFSPDAGIVGQVFRTSEPVHSADVAKDCGPCPDLERLVGSRILTLDCVPLPDRRGGVLGVLLLANRRFPGNPQRLAEMGRRAAVMLVHRPLACPTDATQPVPPQPAAESALTETTARTILLGLISERTGFPVESLRDDAALIDDLNLDSIKIGALLADAALKLGVQGKVDPVHLGNSKLGAVIAAFEQAQASVEAKASALSLLFDLAVERTGFDRASLSLEQRLLDDLNIDSIKAASLLGDLILKTRTLGKIEAGRLINARLGEIAAALQNAMDGAGGTEHPPTTIQAGTDAATPTPWVRAFSVTRVETPQSPIQDEPTIPAGDSILLTGDAASPLAGRLARRLGAQLCTEGDLVSFTLFRNQAHTLIFLLSDGMAAEHGNPCGTAVDELALLHRLARLNPELWQGLDNIVFIQHTGGMGLLEAPGPSARSFAASLQLERPGLRVRVIDFDPGLSADFVIERTADEITALFPESVVEYDREGGRWIFRVAPVEPEDCRERSLRWSPGDVLLVTGGGKGITAECALAFAQETGVKLALVGRSHPGDKELATNLRRLAAAGIEHRYYAADVADRPALADAIARVRNELGPVTGVLHGAGTNIPRSLTEVSAEQARQEIAPKLRGAENLIALLEDEPPKFFAALTSIIGVTGMKHNAWYAYSNEAVARLLQGFAQTHPGTATVCYAFSVWDEIGMGVKLDSLRHLGQMGVDAIPVEAGVRQFLRWARTAPPTGEVIMTARTGALATGSWPQPPQAKAGRFEGETHHFTPGLEWVGRVQLDARRHLYLNDHNYRGSLLLPTVMGLEAMAEACLRVAGTDLEIVRIEDIRLERPIVVCPDLPATIEIRALAVERVSASDPRVVETSLHTEQTGMGPAHFSARFVLGRREAAGIGDAPPPFAGLLGVIPRMDLYGGILFQGPLFQRIGAIEALDSGHVVFTTEARARTIAFPEGFADEIGIPLALGDPYYRDTLLQAAQLCLTPEVCLPVRIGRIELYTDGGTGGQRRAEAKIVGRDGDRIRVEVTVADENGRLVERISGYEVKALERRGDLPTPAALVERGWESDLPALQRELEERAEPFGLPMPCTVVRRFPGLQEQGREARRFLARPVFHAALRRAVQRYAMDTEDLDVAWLDSGKPVFVPIGVSPADGSAALLEVSLSHDDALLLCVAGSGRQGCDLVAPMARSREQWRAMLGEPLSALLAPLEADGDPLDLAGARVWAALEAAMKALDSREVPLRIAARNGGTVVFEARDLWILTFPGRLLGYERMVAVVAGTPSQPTAAPLPEQPSPMNPVGRTHVNGILPGSGNPADWLGFQVDRAGGKGADALVYRFPLAFKDGANPDGTLYFVRLFEWMGRLREMALQPVMARLSGEFAAGNQAWVTNRSWAEFEHPVRGGELMEASVRFLGRAGPGDSIVVLGFDWHRIAGNGAPERVATSRIEMTWARVVSHGVVTPAPYPPYLDDFFQGFAGAADGGYTERDGLGHRQALKRIGASLWRAGNEPGSGAHLSEQSFPTSTNDANLVGNLYYTKYYELQGALRDRYLFGIFPEAYRAATATGGMRCVFTEVKHLRDAMPFDILTARMRVTAVHEKGIELGFEFFRAAPSGRLEKLATAVHVAAWKPGQGRGLARLPLSLRQHFMAVVGGAYQPGTAA